VTTLRGRVPSEGLDNAIVEITGPTITAVTPAPGESDVSIWPGLIDIHCHGGGGHTLCTTDQDEALAAADEHHRAGTAGVVASLVTAPADVMIAQIRALAPLVADGHLLGIHLEGPFLSEARRGAQSPRDLLEPDTGLAARFVAAGDGAVAIVTIAPELAGADDVIRVFREAGVTVALGHTDSSYDVMRAAIDRLEGAALITHLANGMPPLHHRQPGPVAAALVAAARGEATVELIDDGVHVDHGFADLVFAATADDHVALITDAMAAAGFADGEYQLGPQRVRVEDGVARLDPGGALAGGTSHLAEDVARAGGTARALRAATQVPARLLGLDHAPRVLAGRPADLIVVEPSGQRLVMRDGQFPPR
jgi:N-acetylglucosamine-6-phosphate deacetylase